jgi:hypothetical protein
MNANDTNAAGTSGGPPVLLKNADGFEWPDDLPMFYLVARDGLYVCRNHDLFRSCVPANGGPRRLADQTSFLLPRFPRIPRELFEQSVGFFSRIADLHGSEAAALFYWDQGEQRVRLHVPDQVATVARYSDGYVSPIGVHYTPPTDLPDDWILFGDVHCHVRHSAYASGIDKDDELHSAGLHVVVGHIHEEPPDLHVEAVVDGRRFRLDAERVIEGYGSRDLAIPEEWIERVEVEEPSYGSGYGRVGSAS